MYRENFVYSDFIVIGRNSKINILFVKGFVMFVVKYVEKGDIL